jgi:hypothetical protein
MRMRMHAAVIAALAAMGGAGAAQALTIDFDDFAFNDKGIHDLTPISGTLEWDGFVFTPSQFTKFDVLGTQEARFAGEVAMFNNENTGTTTLTRDGGGTFAVESIDVANILGPGANSITFHGAVHGGGTVTQSFTFDSFGHLTTLFLDNDFANLDALSFDENGNPSFQFTDLVVDADAAVPEPAGVTVLGGALVGVMLARRRRRTPALPIAQ